MTGDPKFLVDLDGIQLLAETSGLPLRPEEFLRGPGLLETLCSRKGRLRFAAEHLSRLRTSCKALGLHAPPAANEITRRIRSLLAANGLETGEARIRIRFAPDDRRRSSMLITARPVNTDLDLRRERGVGVLTSRLHRARPELATHKTLDCLGADRARRDAQRRGAEDALIFDEAGQLLEGSSSNVLRVRSGILHTTPSGLPFLAGITQGIVLALAIRAGICTREEPGTARSLLHADEVFLTSSVRELVPVTHVDGHPVGTGDPGPITRALQKALLETT